MSKTKILEQILKRRHEIANKMIPYKVSIEYGKPTKEEISSYAMLNDELIFIDQLILDFKA